MNTYKFTKNAQSFWKACDIHEVNRLIREGWEAVVCR